MKYRLKEDCGDGESKAWACLGLDYDLLTQPNVGKALTRHIRGVSGKMPPQSSRSVTSSLFTYQALPVNSQ